ncbi:hypothetical protein FACS1894127_0080 [Clostridia bacterium]|nr:hypothetical protein FACS1894127_0080 [Clostridia bacterium]
MKIKLQNRYIIPLVPFLQGMKLKGEDSRARSKFLNLVTAAYAQLHESELELACEYAVTGEDGQPVMDESGGFTLKPGVGAGYLTEREKLFSEVAEIEGGTYTAHLEVMQRILTEYDEVLDGENAQLYDALLDAFEEAGHDDQ